MVKIDIPGRGTLLFQHVVLDMNGTIACDGIIGDPVKKKMNQLAQVVDVHVITADTFGSASEQLEGVHCDLHILPKDNQTILKAQLVKDLGAATCMAVGNGVNDSAMLKLAAVGVCTVQKEGAAMDTIRNADIVVHDILDALDLLYYTDRLKATLRS